MSVQSDDTDILLLIPPDFFMVRSDSEEGSITFTEPTNKSIVSDLISQVNDLEGRICLIENKGIKKSDKMMSEGNLKELKHFGSVDTLYESSRNVNHNSRSLQNTPVKSSQTAASQGSESHKNVDKLNKKFIHHKNILLSSDYLNQKERDNLILKEVDQFFKKREIEANDIKESVFENLESASNGKFEESDCLYLSAAVFNLNKINDLLRHLEETQAEIEQKLMVKIHSGVGNSSTPIDPRNTSKEMSDNYKDLNQAFKHNETCKGQLDLDCLTLQKNSIPLEGNIKTDFDACGQNINSQNKNENEFKHDVSKIKLSEEKTELLCLGTLKSMNGEAVKNDEGEKSFDELNAIKKKYKEELCRRQHCEEVIHRVQVQLLEEHQKLAVALRVDKEKNEAITKLAEGWNKLVNLLRRVENEKNTLEKQLESERKEFEVEVIAAFQTVKRYEIELSKALSLAHEYKSKCELLEKKNLDLSATATRDIENLKGDVETLKKKLENETNQREKLENVLSVKEDIITQGRMKVLELQNQIQDHKKHFRDCETELKLIKQDKDKFLERFKGEKNRVSGLQEEKKILSRSNEELKKREKNLRETIASMNEQAEKMKVDLKEFYQAQVEEIVQEKLKEFQDQLAVAEKTLRKEAEEREKRITEMAVKQVHQMAENHLVETNILEEKHRQEIELWKFKFFRSEEKANKVRKELDQCWNQKSEIARKLQTVMEAHWQEALKIIAASDPQDFKSSPNHERNNAEKVVSRQNTFTMTSLHNSKEGEPTGKYFSQASEREICSPRSSFAESAFCREGQLTSRDRYTSNSIEMESDADDPLKKYIRMLLERPPGFPSASTNGVAYEEAIHVTDFKDFDTSESSNVLQWQQILNDQVRGKRSALNPNRVDLLTERRFQIEMRYIYTGGQVTPKECKYGSRPAEGILLTDLEWWSITDHLVREQREREMAAVQKAKEEAKKDVSFQMTKNWSNTLASVKTQSEQKRIEKREREKQDKIDKYKEIIENRREEKKIILEEVKKILRENKEYAKAIKSGILTSAVLKERKEQIMMKNRFLEEEKTKNKELGKQFKVEADDYEREKIEEKIKERNKKKRQKEELDKQVEDLKLRKRIDDEERARDKQDLVNMKIEEDKIRQCNFFEKKYRKEFAADNIKKTQHQIDHERKLALEQEEEDEINKIYVEYGKKFQNERKKREKEMMNKKVDERTRAGEKLAEKFRELDEKECKRLEETEREKAAEADRETEEKRRRKVQFVSDVLDQKRKAEEEEKRRKHEAREATKWEMIQAWRTAEVNAEWRRNLRETIEKRKRETRAVYDEQCREADERKAEFLKESSSPEKDVDDDDDEGKSEYGRKALDFVKSHDMPSYPVLAALAKISKKKIKKENETEETGETLERKKKQEFSGNGCYCFKC